MANRNNSPSWGLVIFLLLVAMIPTYFTVRKIKENSTDPYSRPSTFEVYVSVMINLGFYSVLRWPIDCVKELLSYRTHNAPVTNISIESNNPVAIQMNIPAPIAPSYQNVLENGTTNSEIANKNGYQTLEDPQKSGLTI